jgi:hypothetical protein
MVDEAYRLPVGARITLAGKTRNAQYYSLAFADYNLE